METKGFFIGEVVKEGWKVMKQNLWFFVLVVFLAFIIPGIPNLISNGLLNAVDENQPDPTQNYWFLGVGLVIGLIGYILNLTMSMGLYKISLRFTGGQKGKVSDLFTQFPKILKYFVASVLYMLILLAGLVLLVFPMFIWATRYMLFPFFVIDKNAGPVEALKLSAKATMGAKWDLFGFSITSFFIVLAGALALLVGLFAAIPVVLIAHAVVYRKLLSQTPNFVYKHEESKSVS